MLIGHSSTSILDTYAKAVDEYRRSAIPRLENLREASSLPGTAGSSSNDYSSEFGATKAHDVSSSASSFSTLNKSPHGYRVAIDRAPGDRPHKFGITLCSPGGSVL